MTTRDRLHRLADALADVLPDADAEALARVLDAMAAGVLDPAARAALLAPDDDEPETDAERAGVAEARAALAAGDVLTAAEVRAALQLDARG